MINTVEEWAEADDLLRAAVNGKDLNAAICAFMEMVQGKGWLDWAPEHNWSLSPHSLDEIPSGFAPHFRQVMESASLYLQTGTTGDRLRGVIREYLTIRGDSFGDTRKNPESPLDDETYATLKSIAETMREENLSFRRACNAEFPSDTATYGRLKKAKQRHPQTWALLSGGDNAGKSRK